MINTGFIKGGAAGSARVDYYLSRAQLEQYPRTAGERDAAARQLGDGDQMTTYYASHAANGPSRWLGRGADALGTPGQPADPEQFRRGVLEGYADGAVRAQPKIGIHPDDNVAAAVRRRSAPARRRARGRPGRPVHVRPVGLGVGGRRGPPTDSRRRRHSQ